MKKTALSAAFLLLVMASAVNAANAPVNIAHPINGSSITNYFHSSFTTTCSGGGYTVRWLIDNILVGNSAFYDSASIDFDFKAPTGWHTLQVISSCGQDIVKFYVQ